MSWSLRVSGQTGDLVLDQGHLGTVDYENKLTQDLRHFLLERMGTDDMHPSYGSLIDGGQLPSGRTVGSVIGEWDDFKVRADIESDIRRICAEYQRTQLERARLDKLKYNKTTLSAGEILASVDNIDFYQNLDVLTVTIYLVSGRGQDRSLLLQLKTL